MVRAWGVAAQPGAPLAAPRSRGRVAQSTAALAKPRRTLHTPALPADFIAGLDHGSSLNKPGNDGLDVGFDPRFSDFNTGGSGGGGER